MLLSRKIYRATPGIRWTIFLVGLALLLVSISSPATPVEAQVTPSFTASGLQGESSNNPTSLQFGPDGRLYVSQQNGIIYAYTVVRSAPNDYQVTATEQINDVKEGVPNHNDDGTPNGSNNRQVTGILVTGTGLNPVLYVTSSDPRIGAGGGGNDTGLDTNSGVISRLTCTGGIANDTCQAWEKVDIVRGLPRSEENHSSNGLALDEANNILYLAQGGHANAGAPSNNFAFTTEYALSAAILSIDLDAIEALPILDDDGVAYIYDLPTVDDPTRPNVNGIDDPDVAGYDGVDPGDPFGGQDGLNQARLVPGGPVQIHSPGWRNLYDLVITEAGRMYGVDNGANGGWGGHPAGESDYPGEPTFGTCTNDYIPGEPGSTGTGPGGDDKVNNKNGLHYVRELVPGDFNFVQAGELYYAGHPTPIRGNPSGAGLYTKGSHTVDPNDGGDDYWRNQILDPSDPNFATQSLPVDWPPVPVELADPAECDFRNSGQDDNAIANYGPSTNGITEYTATNFGGALQGDLIMAAFNGNLYLADLNEAGDVVQNCPTPPFNGTSTLSNCNATFASGFGSSPLDVVAQGDNDPFGGTVWAATYGADNITIFEPDDYDGNDPIPCTGNDDDTIDEDGDGYTNADEIDNNTNPCSGASQPTDNDDAFEFGASSEFKRSDLNDTDDDNDTILDEDDSFALDAANGTAANLPIYYELFNDEGFGFFNVGFTGLMTNGTTDYLDQFETEGEERIIAGGTAGVVTITSVPEGDAFGNNNDQLYGFQFGINVDQNTNPFTIRTQINGPFFQGVTNNNFASQGLQIGTGDQDNYLKLVIRPDDSLQILFENDGSTASQQVISNVTGLTAAPGVQLFFSVDPAAGTVQARYAIDNGPIIDAGNPVTLSGDLLDVVQGNYQINGVDSALAVGLIATSFGNAEPFAASWDYFGVEENPSDAQAFVQIDTGSINGSTFGNGSFFIENTSTGANITSVSFDLSTAILPEVVFDPNGTAGDGTSKDLTLNNGSDGGTSLTSHTFDQAYEGGFYQLDINFGDFNPGEQLEFGLDIDPISIKGGSAPGPNESGSVSGLELAGTTVTVEFDDGTSHTVELYRTQPDSDGASENIVRNLLPAAPTIEMIDVANQSTVFNPDQVVRVSGPVGSDVTLLQLEAGLFVEELNGPYAGVGYDIDPWEVNSVIAIDEFDGTIGQDGYIDFNVTLTDSDPEAGFNLFAAVVNATIDAATSELSNVVIVELDETLQPDVIVRINSGGPEYTDGDGNVWSADQYFDNGQTFSKNNLAIENTEDDTLYQTERYGGQNNGTMSYSIPVPAPGNYYVNLHFAEIFQGVNNNNGAGSRVFDVTIEGELFLDDYDIIAQAGGPATAIIENGGPFNVSDGTLNIAFSASEDNAKISAIEVLTIPTDPGNQLVVDPIADQASIEGDDVAALGLFVSATGGEGNLSYSALNLPPGAQLEPTNGQFFGVIDAGAAANSPYAVEVTVSDEANPPASETIMFSWTVLEPGAGTVVYRVNNGGAELSDTPIAWEADQAATGANANGTAQPGTPSPYYTIGDGVDKTFGANNTITNNTDAPDALFQTERFSDAANPNNMQWDFPVANGSYQVNLYFAELWNGADEAGIRVFDVEVEGSLFLDDYDVFVAAGNAINVAVVESTTVTVSDGNLDIDFIKGPQNPAIKGIEIIALNAGGNTPPTIDQIADITVDEGDPINVAISASDAETDPITLSIAVENLSTTTAVDPAEYTFVDNTDGTASFAWLTDSDDVGSFLATVTADDGTDTSTETFTITINDTTDVDDVVTDDVEAGETVSTSPAETQPSTDNPVITSVTAPVAGMVMVEEVDTATQTPPTGFSFIGQQVNITAPDADSASDPLIFTFLLDPALVNNVADLVIFKDGVQVAACDDPDAAPNAAPDPCVASIVDTGTAIEATVWTTTASAWNFGTVPEPTPQPGEVLHRINVGGPQVATANGSQPDWSEDTATNPSPFRVAGSNGIFPTNGNPTGGILMTDPSIPPYAPAAMFGIERWDQPSEPEMLWQFPIAAGTEVEVRLYFAEIFSQANTAGFRVFDVEVEGVVPANLDDIDQIAIAGFKGAFMRSTTTTVSADGTLDIEFIHVTENPAVKGIEIIALGDAPTREITIVSPQDGDVIVGDSITVEWTSVGGDDTMGDHIHVQLDDEPYVGLQPLNGSYTFENVAPGPHTIELVMASVDHDEYTETLTTIDVTLVAPGALVEINPGGGLGASTFSGGSFQITNTTQGGDLPITSLTINLATAILPDMVFDPTGSGGDATSNCLTPSSGATTVGFVAPTDPCVNPYSVPRNGGFDVLTVNFNDFNATEFFTFTTDVDPNNIQGVSGAGNAGAVSGYELIGSTVTVTFSDGTTLTGNLYEDGSLGGSQVILPVAPDTAPSISVVGVPQTPANVSDANQTILVSGPAGANVSLLVMDTRLYIASGDPPFDVTPDELPFYANEAMSGKALYTAVIEPDGDVEIPITLLQTDSGNTTPDGGLNHIIAVLSEGEYAVDQAVSPTSNVVILKLVENAAPTIAAIDDISVPGGDPVSETFDVSDDGILNPLDVTFEITDTSTGQPAVVTNTPTLTDNQDGMYTFGWQTTVDDLGTYEVTISAFDGELTSTETFVITVTGGIPEAYVAINPGAGITSSTFNGGFIVTNNSTGDLTITSVSFDLSTAMYPNMVFDPNGTAGDAAGKCFTPTGGTASPTGLVVPSDPCDDPFSAPRGNGGFDVVSASFSDFQPGETFTFAVDVDPTSIENASGTGSSGSVSGLELTGSTVTVTFSDGTTLSGEIYRVQPSSNGGAENTLTPDSISPAPALTVLNTTPTANGVFQDAVIDSLSQTVQISGPANASVSLLVIESDLLVGQPTPDMFEANEAQSVSEFDATLDGSGTVDIPVTLTDNASGDLYYLTAVVNEPDGRTSDIAGVWRLKFDDNTPPTIDPIADVTLAEGETQTVTITATDPDTEDTVTLGIDIPDFTSFTFNNATGELELTPQVGDVGTYTATVTADDGTAQTQEQFTITVTQLGITLNGSLELQGRTDFSTPVEVKLYNGTTEIATYNTTTDAGGAFTIENMNVPAGPYTVRVKPALYLSMVETIQINTGTNTVTFGVALAGDANGDNTVSSLDFSLLAATFNLTSGDTGFNPNADFNGDNVVSSLDFSLLASNFNQVGEAAQ